MLHSGNLAATIFLVDARQHMSVMAPGLHCDDCFSAMFFDGEALFYEHTGLSPSLQ